MKDKRICNQVNRILFLNNRFQIFDNLNRGFRRRR